MALVLSAGINNWPASLRSTHEKISCVAVSEGYVCLGLTDGHVKLFYNTKSRHLSLLWKKHLLVSVDHVGINQDETFLVVTGSQAVEDYEKACSNVVLLEIPSGEVSCVTEIQEEVSALGWVGGLALYVGGKAGSVFLQRIPGATANSSAVDAGYKNGGYQPNDAETVSLGEKILPKAVQILSLDSEVVAIDGMGGLLVCSTLTRAVLCNHNNKTYREVGSKLRNGYQGVLVHASRIWAARPGYRIWEVDLESGQVLATRQFRKVLEETPETCVYGLEVEPGYQPNKVVEGAKDPGFTLLRPAGQFILSYTACGMLYLLDLAASSVLARVNTKLDIKEVTVLGSEIIILDTTGKLCHITFGTLDVLMTASYGIDKFQLCADLFLSNRKLIRSLKQEHLTNILRLKDLSFKLKDASRAAKIYKLLDAVERLGVSLSRRRCDGQRLSISRETTRRTDHRSVSQDRNGLHSSTELLLKEEIRSGRCVSEEDLLDGRKRRKSTLVRDLSGSRRAMSASEQGLQALQLYNIKFGDKPESSNSSHRSSVESLGALKRTSDSDSPDTGVQKSCERLRERLEEQARDAGIVINKNKQEQVESKSDQIREFSTRISEWEYGGAYSGLDDRQPIEDTDYISEAITGAFEDAASLSKIGGAALTALLEKRNVLDSPRSGLSSRIKAELRTRERQSRINEVARISGLVQQDPEFRVSHTKNLSSQLIQLLINDNPRPVASDDNVKDRDDIDDDNDEAAGEQNELFQCLSESAKGQIQGALCLILGDSTLSRCLFIPFLDLAPTLDDSGFLYQQRCLMFDQSLVDLDALVGHYLGIFGDIIDCDSLVNCLSVQNFCAFKKLIELDMARRPALSPIRLEEISAENVFSVSSFLSTYRDLTTMDLVRYIGEIMRVNAECCIQMVQSQVLDLQPQVLLFCVLRYLEVLLEATEGDSCELLPEMEAAWFSFLCRALAVHIPGWPRDWSQICCLQPSLLAFIANAFAANNTNYLNKQHSIKGSHKSLDAMELTPLANFLMGELGIGSPTASVKGASATSPDDDDAAARHQMEWAKKNSFMPGYVRSLLLMKAFPEEEIPLLIELADSELLYDLGLVTVETAPKIIQHINAIYQKGECPLDLAEFAQFLLRGTGAVNTLSYLRSLAHLLSPGDLSKRFYADLIVNAMEEKHLVQFSP